LKKKGHPAIGDLSTEFETGIKLMQLINALYDVPIPKHNANPKMRPHKLVRRPNAAVLLPIVWILASAAVLLPTVWILVCSSYIQLLSCSISLSLSLSRTTSSLR
jgi:4-hydroxybenzoate polyprenyltransferase